MQASKKLIFAPTLSVLREVLAATKEHPNNVPLKLEQVVADIAEHYQNPSFSLLGPALGCPAAAVVLEPFLKAGVDTLIIIGTVGAIETTSQLFSLGDFVLPTEIISDTQTSIRYGAKQSCAFPENSAQNQFKQNINQFGSVQTPSIPVHNVSLVTTDTPYENSWSPNSLHANSLPLPESFAVDMELSAVCQLCRLYSTNLAAAFVISDITRMGVRTTGFRHKTVKSSLKTLCRQAVELLAPISQ